MAIESAKGLQHSFPLNLLFWMINDKITDHNWNWTVQLQVINVIRGVRAMADDIKMEKFPSMRSTGEVDKEVGSQGDAAGDTFHVPTLMFSDLSEGCYRNIY